MANNTEEMRKHIDTAKSLSQPTVSHPEYYQINYRISTKISLKGKRSAKYNAMIAAINGIHTAAMRHRDTSCWILQTSQSSTYIKNIVSAPLDTAIDHLAVVKIDIHTRVTFP